MKLMNGISWVIMFLCLQNNLIAQHYTQKTSTRQHMTVVNKEWLKHQDLHLPPNISFESDDDRIQFHLNQVIKHLKKTAPLASSSIVQQKRMRLLEELSLYAARQVFPKNIYHPNYQPYFIDHLGTHCAVGYMMKVSGNGELAQRISQEHNYDYLADIKTPGIQEWAENNGFLLEELAWIQPQYPSPLVFETIEKGTNGNIVDMATKATQLFFAGSFDLVDSLPCLNVGVYENGQLSCLGGGIKGLITDIDVNPNTDQLTVVGDFYENNIHYPIAFYHGLSWYYVNLPGRTGAVGLAVLESSLGNTFKREVVIRHDSIVGTEVWREISTGNWQRVLSCSGFISTIEYTNYGKWYGGDFDSITVHQQGLPDSTIYSHNAISQDLMGAWEYLIIDTTGMLPDTVKEFASYDSIVYIGGVKDASTTVLLPVAVTPFVNGSIGPPILFDDGSPGFPFNISDLEVDQNNGKLYIAGSFEYPTVIGYYYNNLYEYDPSIHNYTMFSHFSGEIHAVKIWQNEMYIGGNLVWHGQGSLNYLAKFPNPYLANHPTVSNLTSIHAYPNPTTKECILDLGQVYKEISLEIINPLGQTLFTKSYQNRTKIHLSLDGSKGLYLIRIKTEEGHFVLKVIKH